MGLPRRDSLSQFDDVPKHYRRSDVVAFCTEDGTLQERLKSVLNSRANVRMFGEWEPFSAAAVAADCVVAVIPMLTDTRARENLEGLITRCRFVPIVLITRPVAVNARLLRGLLVQEVFWESEINARLASTVVALEMLTPVATLSQLVSGERGPSIIVGTLRAICRSRGVIREEQLAASVGVSRSTLLTKWHRFMPAGPSLKSVLDWVLLVRAVTEGSKGLSWHAVSEVLNVNEQTLARIARRLVDRPLRELRGESCEIVEQGFRREILSALAQRLDSDNSSEA